MSNAKRRHRRRWRRGVFQREWVMFDGTRMLIYRSRDGGWYTWRVRGKHIP